MNKQLEAKEAEALISLQKRQQLDGLKPQNKQAAQDVERHRIKLQRKCKHMFNTNGQCSFCGKLRSAHI